MLLHVSSFTNTSTPTLEPQFPSAWNVSDQRKTSVFQLTLETVCATKTKNKKKACLRCKNKRLGSWTLSSQHKRWLAWLSMDTTISFSLLYRGRKKIPPPPLWEVQALPRVGVCLLARTAFFFNILLGTQSSSPELICASTAFKERQRAHAHFIPRKYLFS